MKTSFACLLLCLVVACTGQNRTAPNTIAPAEFAQKIKETPNAQILDVRTPEEYSGGHIENAVNVNWNDSGFAATAGKFDKSKPIFVYCLAGSRSHQAAEKLGSMGFTHVYDLQGGIMKWNAAGLGKAEDSAKLIGMCPQEYGEMIASAPRVLVNFYADWCEPCKKMKPYMTTLGDAYKGKLLVTRLNADEHKTMVSNLKIDELPVILLYENQKLVWQHKGYISEEELKQHLQ